MRTRGVRARGAATHRAGNDSPLLLSPLIGPGGGPAPRRRGLRRRRGHVPAPKPPVPKVPNRRGPRRASRRAGGGARRPHKGSGRPGFRAGAPPPAGPAPPRAARPRPAPPPAPGGGGRGSPAGTRRIVSTAAAALERPPRARHPAVARAPAPASRPRRPLLSPARPVRSDAPRQPRAPARRLPADRRRPARARDSAPGGARPRGCVGPARPGPAGPRTGQCRAGEGCSPGGSAARAPRAPNRAPPFGAAPGPGLLGCQAVPAAALPPGARRCPAPPPLLGDPPAPRSRGGLCRQTLPCVPVRVPPRAPAPPPSRRRVAGVDVPFKGPGCLLHRWGLLLGGLRLRRRVWFSIQFSL